MAASSRVPLEVAVAGDASRFGDAASHAAFIFAFGTPVLFLSEDAIWRVDATIASAEPKKATLPLFG